MKAIRAYKTLNGDIVEDGTDALVADISYLFEQYKRNIKSEVPCEPDRFKEWIIEFVRYNITDFKYLYNQYNGIGE